MVMSLCCINEVLGSIIIKNIVNKKNIEDTTHFLLLRPLGVHIWFIVRIWCDQWRIQEFLPMGAKK
jgi:hypothetical protein